MKRHIKKVIGIYIMVMVRTVLSAGCSTKPLAPEPFRKAEYGPTNGWRYSTPEEQGMDSGKLARQILLLSHPNSCS